jgi:hypothetical protein
MLTPTVENTDISKRSLDGSSGISGIEDVDTALRLCVSVILMSRPTDIPSKLANFEAVTGYVRETRTALDKAVGGLDHEPTGDALGYASEMMTGLDTTLITLEHLARTLQAASNQTARKPRPKPFLHVCGECDLAFLPDWEPHECGGRNAFHPDALDQLLGFDGYRVKYSDGTVEPDDDEPPTEAEPEAETEPEPRMAAGRTVAQAEESYTPAPTGMRDGSKIHRIYVATGTLLDTNGEMHIDEMLKSVSQIPGLFSGVKEPRAYFANKLSVFRKKGLVLSDNRGNYSLPNGRAAG